MNEGDLTDGSANSDQILSDSWTILDSSHLEDDDNLSDAESVEVLNEDLDDETWMAKCSCSSTCSSTAHTISPDPVQHSSVSATLVTAKLASQDDTITISSGNVTDTSATEKDRDDSGSAGNSNSSSKRPTAGSGHFQEGARLEVAGETFSAWLLELAVYSLLIDLLLLCYFGMTSIVGAFEKHSPQHVRTPQANQFYEMDPLHFQISHVLSEWRKHPSEDHTLDRQVLKTLLMYYAGGSELSANLHYLTQKVQKHNEIIRNLGKVQHPQERHRMIISGHLAHAVACILGKGDNDKAAPAELYVPVNSSHEEISEFAPEPGFWLNDWYLPHYVKANDTYYRTDVNKKSPAVQNPYFQLEPVEWSDYFWKWYHKGNTSDSSRHLEKDNFEIVTVGSDSDVDGEETERSPPDLISTSDFATIEESSGNPEDVQQRIEEDFQDFGPDYGSGLNFNKAHVDRELKHLKLDKLFEALDDRKFVESDRHYFSRYTEPNSGFVRRSSHLLQELVQEQQGNYDPSAGKYTSNLKKKEHTDEIYEVLTQNERLDQLTLDEGWNKGPKTVKKSRLLEELDETSLHGDLLDIEQYYKLRDFGDVGKTLEEVPLNVLYRRPYRDHVGFSQEKHSDAFEEGLKRGRPKKKTAPDHGKRKRRKFFKCKSNINCENSKGRGKFKRKEKEQSKFDIYSQSKIKVEVKKKEKLLVSDLKGKFAEEVSSDWNTRMAQGREKLRALRLMQNEQIWLFDRARARHERREETFSK